MKRILILLIALIFVRNSSAQDDQSKPWYLAAEGKAEWIWLQGDTTPEQAFFRKTFEIPEGASALKIYSSCDNQSTLTLDGKLPVGSSSDWMYPVITEIAVEPGTHTLAVEGKNRGGIAAFVCIMEYEKDGSKHRIYTDKTWQISAKGPEGWTKPGFDDSTWSSDQIRIMGKFGSGPWKIPGAKNKASEYTEAPDPLDPANITTLSGFSVEHLYTVPKTEQGSWVSLTEDDKGRLYASDQKNAGLFQIKIVDTQGGSSVTVKKLSIPEPGSKKDISGAQGLQYAKGSLYFHKNGGHMFEITDEDGDGELDTARQVPSERGGGEHGNHDVIIAPDGENLIMIGGNHAPLAEHTKSSVRGWEEDLLLPRMWDARGHARGKLAPGGWVTRLDPEAHTQEVLSVGYRNQYGIALNKYGDLFTYDADMEWDLGMPWYRPTRVCLVASGSDYGWRSGTGKWPTYFEDSLPPVVEIGPGSPTGVISGTGSNFPEKYQEALFALDWTFGTIYAIHLKEKGAGYTGEAEPFLFGSPLPLTDAVIGKDGKMYFLIGGRGTQSALFRVSYDGSGQIPATTPDPEAEHARKLRRSLEVFHGLVDSSAVEAAWPLLSSDDRFLRHAARVAIESQPVDEWAARFYSETSPQAVITAAVALARQGEPSLRNRIVEKLLELDVADLSETQKLGLLRAYSLTFIRMGQPDAIPKAKVIASIDPLLPSESDDLNNELIKMLVYLEASSVIEKGMKLITDRKPPAIPDWSELAARNSRYGGTVQAVLNNHPPTREIGYALMLSNLRDGWTMENRRRFFTFLNEAANASGGASYPGFLANIRQQALAGCSDEERSALSDITGENFNPVPDFEIIPPKGPGKVWTLNEAVSQGSRRGANFENGRSLYFSVGCGACHRFRGLGGGVGPDLTSIPTKFDDKYVIEAIIDPGKDISDQYGSFIVTMKDGSTHNGITVEKGDQLEIYLPDPVAKPTVVSKDDVKSIEQSPISQMPPGLINSLNKDELRNLMAYLMSGGNPDDRRFQK
ncbi:MAG: c-type cytochrome [Verrucomicrobiales bacterium]|nr:c-type cytochrome [Verrucomicrobiales bacterium]